MTFDPKTDGPADSSRREKNVKKMYEKLRARGDDEAAEELRNAGGLASQASYIGQQVVAFDPKHDADVNTAAKIRVKNVYDALVELGYGERADELRGYMTVSSQNRRAVQVVEEVDAEIDPVTGDVEPAG
jgi:hypothetical protein